MLDNRDVRRLSRVGSASAGSRARWRFAARLLSCSLCLALTIAAGAPPAAAEEDGSRPAIELHGFVSQGFLLSTKNEYLARSKGGSLEFSEAAFNVTASVSERLRLGFQVLSRDLGSFGNYAPQLDWYYLDYRVFDWLGVRAGRLKMPFGLYNELNDVDVARLPILLPQSIYPASQREYLFAQTGGEIYGHLPLGAAGALEYRAYGGTLSPDSDGEPPPPLLTVLDARFPYVYGARLFWWAPLEGLLVGGSGQALRLDSDVVIEPAFVPVFEALGIVPPGLPSPLLVKFRVSRWVASLQYVNDGLDVSAEYSRWKGQFYSPAPALFPREVVNERYHVMASYRFHSLLTLGSYYSGYFPNVDDRRGKAAYQHDVALTTRHDLTSHWLLKLEGHYMHGTASLSNRSLNEGLEPSALARRWLVFLAKTTAHF